MLVRTMPDQIQANWDIIKQSIKQCNPPMMVDEESYYSNILDALVQDRMQCWVYLQESIAAALLVTEVIQDTSTGLNSLLVFSYSSFIAELDYNSYQTNLDTLTKYARANDCKYIIAYTDQEAVVELLARIGVSKRYYLSLEV